VITKGKEPKNVIRTLTDEFMSSQAKLDTENIIYCKIVLTRLLYNDVKRE